MLFRSLQLQAGLRLQKTLQGGQSARIVGAERRVAAIRAAVNKAASLDELNQSLQTLQGPKLGPAELAQPLPLVKQQILAALERVDQQVARARNAIDPNDRWKLLPDLLRNAIASLALATGFAALAKRPGAQFSLARELQASLLLRRRRPNRSSS